METYFALKFPLPSILLGCFRFDVLLKLPLQCLKGEQHPMQPAKGEFGATPFIG